MPSLGATYGRGAATTAQWDLANADFVMVMGSNMAECHPIAFRFVLQAKERGATIVHVDPRFTRTSALADIYAPIRCGSDIAFLGGLIRYILENDLWFRDYVLNYTNIATIIEDEFKDTSELDGLFSGWSDDSRSYKAMSWQYKGEEVPTALVEHHLNTGSSYSEKLRRTSKGPPPVDMTLAHPNCVYNILKRHYAAYTPEMVEKVTGCPRDTFLKIADAMTRSSGPEKTGALCYAVGWTHHSTGVQMIRAAGIVQALLGNIGRPGGGILALRGHCSIQGSTDIPTLYDMLPGYLRHPNGRKEYHRSFANYLEVETIPLGFMHRFPKFIISLLRAWYGDHAGPGNEWCYQHLPKIMGDHSQLPMTLAIKDGTIRGLLLMGQNPVVGGHNSHMIRMALPNLEWMVVREIFENETASYWYKSPEVADGRLKPEEIKTEMFLLPAALPGEKDGSFTNTHRLIQWHDKVVEPPGDCRSDLWFIYHLGKRLKALYADSPDPKDAPIKEVTWEYPTSGSSEDPSAEAVLKEINGYTWPGRKQLSGIKDIKDDGSTASGCWIYCGAYPGEKQNLTRSRRPDGPDGPGSHRGWGFAWPANRRILYNRASADPAGKPWSEKKKYVWWDDKKGRWTGRDAVDFPKKKAPEYVPDWSENPKGMQAIDGKSPFMMISDGKSSLFVTSGLSDGPLPTHYEPVESPVKNLLYGQQDNPAAKKWDRDDNVYHAVGDPRYPYAITTYRLTEHHSGGIPTRMVPSTAELQPECFVEIPPELAHAKGVKNLEWVVLETARGKIEVRALVTRRLRPLDIGGQRIYQIGMPFHFGWQGYATGAIANVLTAVVGDPNTTIHEGKAFTCNLCKGRLT
ncbi:MAG: molybdopterin-dependent oxidoreductase [Desulfobacterales bacterium]